MFKSTQFKIILIFFIVGIIIISVLGLCFMNSINLINPETIDNEGLENIVNTFLPPIFLCRMEWYKAMLLL